MILHRLGVISFEWPAVLWAALALVGGFKVVHSFSMVRQGATKTGRSGVFWGTLLFLAGLYNVLRELDVLDFPPYLLLPACVLCIGIGFLMTYISAPRDWHLIIPALFFMGLGAVMLLTELGYLYRSDVLTAIKNYWPFALILFGSHCCSTGGLPDTKR